jgi:uncharacterized protein YkvS
MMEIHSGDVTMNAVTVMEIVEITEAVEVVDTSTGIMTKVRPVSLVSSLTRPATAGELIPTAPIVNV